MSNHKKRSVKPHRQCRCTGLCSSSSSNSARTTASL